MSEQYYRRVPRDYRGNEPRYDYVPVDGVLKSRDEMDEEAAMRSADPIRIHISSVKLMLDAAWGVDDE